MGEGEIRDGIFSVINNKCTFVIKDSKTNVRFIDLYLF